MSRAALHASRLDYARQRRGHGRRLPAGTRVRKLGHVADCTVYAVDGTMLRRLVDEDFTQGGNGSRYGYIPVDELWVDECLNAVDAMATLLHEAVEHQLMQDGQSYETAHDHASEAENKLRDKLARHSLRKVNLKIVERALRSHGGK
jgi:hypothetical protein